MRLPLSLLLFLCSEAIAAGLDGPPPPLDVAIAIRSDDPRFGGFSGIEVTPDGNRFFALSDRGLLTEGLLLRAGSRLTGVRFLSARQLKRPNGTIAKGGGPDSEGLAMGYKGGIAVSLEMSFDLLTYSDADANPHRLPAPPGSDKLPPNKKYEALAIDDAGRLYTLAEAAIPPARSIPLWRLDGDHWTMVRQFPLRGGFLPVGADFGLDGKFYLLERRFGMGFHGFGNQVSRYDLSNPSDKGETVWRKQGMKLDNFEGLAVWQTATGQVMLTMISDNDFLPFLGAHVLETALEGPIGKAAIPDQ